MGRDANDAGERAGPIVGSEDMLRKQVGRGPPSRSGPALRRQVQDRSTGWHQSHGTG